MLKTKRAVVLLVTGLLILSLLAGCGKAAPDATAGSNSSAVTTAASNGTSATTMVPEIEKPEKLVIVSGQTIGSNEPEKTKAFLEAFKNMTGVNLEIINNSDAQTVVATKIAAGDQVDVYIGNPNGLYQQNAVVPIEQSWIDSSVNVKNIPQIYWRNFTKKGVIMSVPYRSMMKTALFIRQDWLDKLKLKVPETLDDFYNVTKEFALNDPDGNGKQDTYGYAGQNEWDTCTYFFYPIQNALCKLTGKINYDEDEDKLKYVPFEEDYKPYLSFLQKSYKEKIIEPQIFTNKEENMANLFYTGKTGILEYYCGNTDEIYSKTLAVNPNAKITIMAPPKGPAGSGSYAIISNVSMSIIKGSKDPVAAFKYFCDAIHSPEGQQLLCYGPEGINWVKENGIAKATVPNPSMGLNPTLVINQDLFKPIIEFTPETKKAIEIFDSATKIDLWPITPLMEKAEEEGSLFLEYYAKIITGNMDVEAGLAEWKKKFNEKGLNQYFEDANKDTSWAK